MSDVFISYARSTAKQAQAVADALRGQGYRIWIDDDLPSHRTYSDVIEEQLRAAKAVVVIWSAEAAKSDWVRAEAEAAREARTLVQVTVDGVMPPMPFNQIQCADLKGWNGDRAAAGWRKVVASVADLAARVGAAQARDLAFSSVDASPPLPSKPSIAVMPFANLSGDPEQDYFADGMVEEIVAALSRIRSIFVIGSGSTLSFKGKSISTQEAGQTLGVRYLLEGNVRRAGGRVRVGVKLTNASDGAQIWTERFEDTLEDVFALQDRVALAVAGRIEPTMQEAEIQRSSARPTDNMGSYDLYLRATALFRNLARTETLEALDLLNRAIALDSQFGPALALAGQCHSVLVSFGWSDDPERDRHLAVDLAHRALRVAGEDTVVMAAAALTLRNQGEDFNVASAWADRALQLNPGSSYAWQVSAIFHLVAGRSDVAIEQTEMSMRLDPLSRRSSKLANIGVARLQQSRFDEATISLKEALQLSPAFESVNLALIACYGHLGEIGAARRLITSMQSRATRNWESQVQHIAASLCPDPEHRKLLLDGVALAEGKNPVDTSAGAE